MSDLIGCKFCCEFVGMEECDCIGACDGNVFCGHCGTEIESDTGEVALLCGGCESCKELKEDDVFDAVQKDREHMRWSVSR